MLTRAAFLAACLSLLVVAPPPALFARDKAPRPSFDPALQPLVGTWKRVPTEREKDEKEAPDRFLVIKDDGGLLGLRYQLNNRKKVYSSDWQGNIVVDLQVNMKEYHDVELAVSATPPRVSVLEKVSFGGTWKDRETYLAGDYELGPDGQQLFFRCRSVRIGEGKKAKDVPCFAPIVFERVSTSTEWPGKGD
jgi:hypothetical protein